MASEGLNKVMLIGNLGMDPEIRFGQSGNAVLRMRLATTERYMTRGGERQERTEWHTVIFFGNRAEGLSKVLSKGETVYIEGRLQTRQWDDKDGNKRYTTEIVGTQLLFLGGRRGEGGGVGAERDRDRDVHPGAHAARADHHTIAHGAPAMEDGVRGAHAEAREPATDRRLLAVGIAAEALDLGPARPARARRLHPIDGEIGDLGRGALADAGADLLEEHRDVEGLRDLGDLVEQAGEARVSFGLHGLLEGVEVEVERVRAHRLEGLLDLRRVDPVVELHRADVAEEQGQLRRRLLHGEARGELGLDDHRALRAEGHAHADPRRGLRQRAVHLAGAIGPAGHRPDQDGRPQRLAAELRGQVHVLEVQLGQRVHLEGEPPEADGRAPGADLLVQDDVEVMVFSALQQRCFFAHRADLASRRSRLQARHRSG